MNSINLVSSLHELSETDPIEVDGIQFGGGGGGGTCQSVCVAVSIVVQTVCVLNATCCG